MKIVGHKNFSRAWIDGSTNHKTSIIIDHAHSEQHKSATCMMHSHKDTCFKHISYMSGQNFMMADSCGLTKFRAVANNYFHSYTRTSKLAKYIFTYYDGSYTLIRC